MRRLSLAASITALLERGDPELAGDHRLHAQFLNSFSSTPSHVETS